MVSATARVPRTPDASSATSTRQGLDPSHIRLQCHLTSPMCLIESNPLKRSALSVGHVYSSGAHDQNQCSHHQRLCACQCGLSHCLRAAQTCSQKSQVGRCTRHLPDKNKSLGAEHHKCSGADTSFKEALTSRWASPASLLRVSEDR